MKKITVIIPCHNEETGIVEVINNLPKGDTLKNHDITIEVLVIDNNSKDNTKEASIKLGANVLTENKIGKGSAMRTGFANISKDSSYVVVIDGDNTYNSNELLNILTPLINDSADVVLGSRLIGDIKHGSMTTFNHIGNHLYTKLVRLFYQTDITDTLTGFVAYKKEVIDQLLPILNSDKFTIEIESITKIIKLNYRIASVPITYSARLGKSKLRPLSDGISIMRILITNIFWRPPSV